MEQKINEFKKFVTEQLESFDEFRETDMTSYVNNIIDKAVKLFAMSHVAWKSEQLVCDCCKCHPTVLYATTQGNFCENCKPKAI